MPRGKIRSNRHFHAFVDEPSRSSPYLAGYWKNQGRFLESTFRHSGASPIDRAGSRLTETSERMPILPAEPEFYPADLWDELKPTAGRKPDGVWWCLHTKPRQEKAAARELRKLELTFYLPQVLKEDRTPQGRKIRSVIPLFTSYLFLHGNPNDRLTAFQGRRLVTVLEIKDQHAIERDLGKIQTMLSSGLPVAPEPSVPLGARVRITTGPLTGVEGTVIRRGKKDQFVAVVRFLGRGAAVDLKDWQVEQVHEP